MALLKAGDLVEDAFLNVAGQEKVPAKGAVIVSLEQWHAERAQLISRDEPVGVQLASDESPAEIAEDLDHLAVVALDFPVFKDGRAYSSARLLRERYGFEGEIRAVGEVLCNQLQFMLRCGIDAYEVMGPESIEEFRAAFSEIGVVYQPTGDGAKTAGSLRRNR